jgi:uridine monophosphate synthetase
MAETATTATTATTVGSGDGRSVMMGGEVGLELLEIVKLKKSNLIVALDVVDPEQLLAAVLAVAPHVCAIKLHLDMIEFTADLPLQLFCNKLACIKAEYRFLLIEDRKFADIGSVMALQVRRLPSCIDIVTAHGITGSLSIAELDRSGKGLMLIHQLSSIGNLIDDKYSKQILNMLPEHKNIVGIISQTSVPNYLTISPGINLDLQKDNAGQQYKTTTDADLFIVGRGIYHAPNITAAALKYKLHLFRPPPTPLSLKPTNQK